MDRLNENLPLLHKSNELKSDMFMIKPNKNRIASNDIQTFIRDPTKFAQINTISADRMTRISELPEESKIQFIKIEDNTYEIEYINDIDSSDNNQSLNSYILGYNGSNPSNQHPAYLDIPKVAKNTKFLFTGTLSGCSIIVTELNADTYRVYHDGRVNSSILYENVIMAIDYSDYRVSGRDEGLAVAYMQYHNGSWQLILQKQEYKIRYGIPIPTLRDGKRSLEIYYPDPESASYKKRKFLDYRKSLHKQISDVAHKFNINTDDLKDEPYTDEKFSLEVVATKPWVKVIFQIKTQMNLDIENMNSIQVEWEDELKNLKSLGYWRVKDNNRIKLLEDKISQNKKYISFYKKQYESLFSEAQTAERSWLWYQIKESKGVSAVINESSIHRRGAEYRPSINKRYNNLIYTHKNSNNAIFISHFNEGIKKFHEIEIPGVDENMTPMQLKEIYLNEDITALERGALYRYIEEVENDEYIKNVLMKTGKVSELFYFSGSKINRLAPQDFYLSLVGDESNGRCYPLVRAMSVALANRGQKGANTLIDRLFLAAANPDDNDSILLKSALAKLHSNTNAVEASFLHGNMDLNNIQELLELKDKTMMFAINTQSHSMLIGKTVIDGNRSYYFYDPNFGLFSFDQSKPLFSAVNKFMIDNKMATYYDAFGTENKPIFTVVSIVIDDMANVPIGNHLNVSNLSESDALNLASEHQQKIEQLIERQDSVDMDIQLKTSLAILDVQQWGESLDKATKALSSEYQLGKEWVPLFSNIEKTDDGHYRVQFIHNETPELTRWVETTDSSLVEFRRYYEEKMMIFEQYYDFEKKEIYPKSGDIETVPIDGLNAGIAIQSLIQWAANRGRNENVNIENSTDLALALKIHTYVNYTMMAHGTMNDAIKMTKLVQTVLKDDAKMAVTAMDGFSSSLARTTNEGLGVIFNGALVGFDIYELTHAENESQEVIFGTQLAFDSAGLIAGTGSIGAGVLGASSTSVALGGAGVILAGLSIGFGGLARNFAIIGEDAKSVGRYFYLLDQAYQRNGYDYFSAQKALVPRFGAVFKTIDLRTNQIEFDSQYIYRTSPSSAGGGRKNYIFWAGNFPTMMHNRDLAINIRAGIGYEESKCKLDFSNINVLILPVIPKSYIKYDYNLWPGATTRHDSGFDVIRRLEKKDNFDYDFYIFPSENTITRIHHEYVKTEIEVKLDLENRHLIIPKLAREWHGYIDYDIRGSGGEYQINLQYGIKIKLTDENDHVQPSRWIIDSGQLNDDTVIFSKNGINVGGVAIEINPDSIQGQFLIINKKNEISDVNFTDLTVSVVSEDNNKWGKSTQTLDSHLHQLFHEGKFHDKYIIVENYKYNGKNIGRAFYDVEKDRFIFNNAAEKRHENVVLGAVFDETAYFYASNEKSIWQVDIASGNIISEHVLTHLGHHPFEIAQVWQENENIYFSCSYNVNGRVENANYSFSENEITLISITDNIALLNRLFDIETNISPQESKEILKNYIIGMEVNGHEKYFTNSDFADVVMISGEDVEKKLHRCWFRMSDGMLIKPNLPREIEKETTLINTQKKQSDILIPQDLILAGNLVDENDNEFFYFYSRENKVIYRQESTSKNIADSSFPIAIKIDIPNLQNTIFWQGNLLVVDEDGVVFQINADGHFHQVALNDYWFKQHQQWWKKLNDTFDEPSMLALFGIKSANGRNIVPAWYTNKKIIIAHELSTTNMLQFLGRNKDDSGILIFDTINHKLYLQPYTTVDELITAFGNGYQIIDSSILPSAVELYPNTQFKTVKKVGAGLLMFTSNDEILYHDISIDNQSDSKDTHIGSSLIIKGTKENDLLIPSTITHVKNLVLSGGDGEDNYVLTELVWQDYETIVIDNYASDSLVDTIVLPVENIDSLLVNQHADDLILTDANANTVLILRQVFGSQAKSHQHIQVSFLDEPKPYTLAELVENTSFKHRLMRVTGLRESDVYDSNDNGGVSEDNLDMLVGAIVPFDNKSNLSSDGVAGQLAQAQFSKYAYAPFNAKQ